MRFGVIDRWVGSIFPWYLRLMTGGREYPSKIRLHAPEPDVARLDLEADRAGDIYRGLGLLVAAMSALVLFLAVAPVALGLGEPVAVEVKTLKVIAMLVTVALLVIGRFGPWRKRWTRVRKMAQAGGYRRLKSLIEDLQTQEWAGAPATGTVDEVVSECQRIMAEQIDYDERTSKRYDDVGHHTITITYYVFALSLLAAVIDVAIVVGTGTSFRMFLLATAFLPGVVGILHGANGFLSVGEQAFSGKLMAARLKGLRERLTEPPDAGWSANPHLLATLADELVAVLEGHDKVWAPSVKVPTV